ncbi:MAG: hypothetical protein LBT98_02580 [Puniceicoccales bacterium]|jgi:hypothetical protein|nr:hypothetical protein [Puniceicoccales bacterium]
MYQLNDREVFMDVTDGVAILINYQNGLYHGTNQLGTWILEQLTAGHCPEHILERLRELPNCPDCMGKRLSTFVEDLHFVHILADGPAAEGELPRLPATLFGEIRFELTLETFNDAQDLLFADPIHEVDEEEGWVPTRES